MTSPHLRKPYFSQHKLGSKQVGILESATLRQSNLLMQHPLRAYYGPESSKTRELQTRLWRHGLASDGKRLANDHTA